MTKELLGSMTETTLGVKDTTWAVIELGSAVLLAGITSRSTYSQVKKAGGIASYLKPRKDSWKSAQMYSNLLITILILKGAMDASKSYGYISGTRAAPQQGHQMLNGYGQQNYF